MLKVTQAQGTMHQLRCFLDRRCHTATLLPNPAALVTVHRRILPCVPTRKKGLLGSTYVGSHSPSRRWWGRAWRDVARFSGSHYRLWKCGNGLRDWHRSRLYFNQRSRTAAPLPVPNPSSRGAPRLRSVAAGRIRRVWSPLLQPRSCHQVSRWHAECYSPARSGRLWMSLFLGVFCLLPGNLPLFWVWIVPSWF